MLILVALTLGAIVVCAPLIMLLATTRRGSGIAYDNNYQPMVTVITPMFNEGVNIRRTLQSILAQDYPLEKLEIIVVDDCSTDDSYQHAKDALRDFPNAKVLRNAANMGKRQSINRAVNMSGAEIIVSVDSDVVVAPDAIRQMIRCFSSPRIAAVGGRVAILNERDNWLSRMQAVKYYYSYFLIKRIELRFRSVLCLSGCLTAYRRHVLQELLPVLENRNILGVDIKYGEDRFLTRMIVKAGYDTIMNVHAVCRTTAPTSISDYLSQQLRWRRSNMVDYFGGLSHVWRQHPAVAIYFYSLFALILIYPMLLVSAAMSGEFLGLMAYHLVVAFVLGIAYRLHAYKDPNASAWNAVPLALTIPLTYGILTPLALLTLDSGTWETRGHQEPVATPSPVPTPMAAPVSARVVTGELVLAEVTPVVRTPSRADLIAVASAVAFPAAASELPSIELRSRASK